MIWVIYLIWVVFALVCVIAEEKTGHDFFEFLLLISIPLMFYVPFMVWLFQNKNLTFVTKYDIINIENKKGEKIWQ